MLIYGLFCMEKMMMLILRACLVWLLAAPAPLHASCAALYITVRHWKRAPAQLLTRQELEEPVIGGFARLRHSAGAGAIGSSTKDALNLWTFLSLWWQTTSKYAGTAWIMDGPTMLHG